MRLLHVTSVLPHPAYAVDPWYLDRGRAVHLATHLLDTVGLDWDSLDPRIEGYVRAWEKCKKEMRAQIIGSEIPIGGDHVGYVGTLDKDVRCPCAEIWDLKCGQPEPWHGLQLAAYDHGLRAKMKRRRRTVHLSADGTYRLIEHKGKDDLKIFLGYLAVAYFEIRAGIREWPAPREGEEA